MMNISVVTAMEAFSTISQKPENGATRWRECICRIVHFNTYWMHVYVIFIRTNDMQKGKDRVEISIRSHDINNEYMS